MTHTLSALRKVFSLMDVWEKGVVAILLCAIVGSVYWNWNIFYLGHTTEIPGSGGKLVEGLVGQPHTINPVLASTQTDLTLVHAIFAGLYGYDTNGQLVPDLANDMPELSENGKQYTVRLKPNLIWHDGKPLTADDVLFTINQIQNEQIQSPQRNLWLSTSVQKIDALTVVFTTKDVSAPFLYNLTIPLLPEHVWKGVSPENFATSPLNLKPLGSGAFAIRQVEKNSDGTFKRMSLASFAGGPKSPKLETITVVFYNSAEELRQGYLGQEITSLGLNANDTLAGLPNEHVQRIALPQYQAVFLNVKSPVLSDSTVRAALRMVTDSEAITQAAWGQRARPISQPPLGLGQTTELRAPSQTAEAEVLLGKNGWIKQADGVRSKGAVRLTIALLTSDAPSFRVAAQLLAEQWKRIGVAVTVKSVPTTELINSYVRPRQYDALLFSQRMSADPEPFAFWHSSQTKDPGLNVSNFTSSEADRLITDARTTTDTAERAAAYAKLITLLDKEHPAIYLNQSLYTYLLSGDIRGPKLRALIDPSWRLSFANSYYTTTTRTWKAR